MREIQITIKLSDTVDSINQLEAIIDAKGQRIKQQLFSHELAHLIQLEKRSGSDSVACPSCKKKVSPQKAINPDN